MKNLDRKKLIWVIVGVIAVCICIIFSEVIKQWPSIFGILGTFIGALSPIIIGAILAFLLNPLMMFIRRLITDLSGKNKNDVNYENIYNKTKVPALIITVLLFIAAIVGILYLVIPSVYQSLITLFGNMDVYIEEGRGYIDRIFSNRPDIAERVSELFVLMEQNIAKIFQNTILPSMNTYIMRLSSGLVSGVRAVLNFFVGFIVMFYLLGNKDKHLSQAKQLLYCIFPMKSANSIMRGASYANSVFSGFINGKILDSVIIGILCFIFTSIVNFKYAILISVIVGITNIIPFFGPFIGAVPGAFLALMDGPIMMLVFIIWILQQFDGNILGPLILGDATGISGVWVMIAILVGGKLFGVAGMILGVPVLACIYAFTRLKVKAGLKTKDISPEDVNYELLTGFDEATGEPIYRDKFAVRQTLKQRRKGKLFTKKSKEREDDTHDKN